MREKDLKYPDTSGTEQGLDPGCSGSKGMRKEGAVGARERHQDCNNSQHWKQV